MMAHATKQANFLLPEDVIEELKATVPKRQQSRVVTDALRKELKRIKLGKALCDSFGAWRDSDHPELEQGTDARIRSLRKSSRVPREK